MHLLTQKPVIQKKKNSVKPKEFLEVQKVKLKTKNFKIDVRSKKFKSSTIQLG